MTVNLGPNRTRRAGVKTIKTRTGNHYYATLGGQAHYRMTPSKQKANKQAKLLGKREASRVQRLRKRTPSRSNMHNSFSNFLR